MLPNISQLTLMAASCGLQYDPSGDTLNLTPDGTSTMVEQTLLQLIYDNAYQQPG